MKRQKSTLRAAHTMQGTRICPWNQKECDCLQMAESWKIRTRCCGLVSRSNISCKSWFNVGMAQKNESKDGVKDERNIKKEEDEKGISVSIFDTTVYINRLNERWTKCTLQQQKVKKAKQISLFFFLSHVCVSTLLFWFFHWGGRNTKTNAGTPQKRTGKKRMGVLILMH